MSSDGGSLGLRAQIRLDSGVVAPQEPIWAHFVLQNNSDATVEVPYTAGGGLEDSDGVGLPLSLVLGTSDAPALQLGFAGESPQSVSSSVAGEARTLRIAPHASVGAMLDVRSYSRQLRYSGEFDLIWKPLGDSGPRAEARLRIEGRKRAVLVTDFGNVTFDLNYDGAPLNVENFLELARRRYYDGLTLHRLVPGFLVQGGASLDTSDGIRPDGKTVVGEFSDEPFDLGTLAMSRRQDDPDSASCQFFIALGRAPNLDGEYSIVGQARDVASHRTLNLIAQQPVDANGRPLRPLVIRFFTLIDVESSSPRTATQPSP